MHTHWILMRPMPEARRAECIGQASNSGKCIGFVLFHEQKECKFINLIHTRQKNNHLLMLWKIINKIALKCH